MTPIYKKVYDLNKHEAKLIRGIIRLAINHINMTEKGFTTPFKAKISDIEWTEYPSVFRNSDYRLSFEYNNALVSCIVQGYAVADVCKGNNILSNGEYIRTASLTFKEYRSEKPITSLFNRRIFINFTLEYDPLIRNIQEGTIEGALLKGVELYNNRDVY